MSIWMCSHKFDSKSFSATPATACEVCAPDAEHYRLNQAMCKAMCQGHSLLVLLCELQISLLLSNEIKDVDTSPVVVLKISACEQ